MILSYAFKRVTRSWKLFLALFLSIVLSSTLFAVMNVGVDTSAKQVFDQKLNQIYVDAIVRPSTPQPDKSEIKLSPEDVTSIANLISSVNGVQHTEIISITSGWTNVEGENERIYFTIAGICDNSYVYDGMTVIEGSRVLGVNEALVLEDSPYIGRYKIGDVINLTGNAVIRRNSTYETFWFTMNFTVAGFVRLTDDAKEVIVAGYRLEASTAELIIERRFQEPDLLIVSWENTFPKIINEINSQPLTRSPIEVKMPTFVDRESLVNLWDVSGSVAGIQSIIDQIKNRVAIYGLSVSNNLGRILPYYNNVATGVMFDFLIVAFPIFFIAWSMATTVSTVAFNLRRREIGMLLTKGLSRMQLLQIFLSESIAVGMVGGVGGAVISLLLTPVFVQALGGKLIPPIISWGSLILMLSFSVTVTFLAVFWPAWKASNLQAVDTLREYLYVPEERAYRKRLTWILFALGTYKMLVLAIGFNVPSFMYKYMFESFNVYGILLFIDYLLNYVGPMLFFWGFIKIFVVGSFKFQSFLSKVAGRSLGDLRTISAKNVQRYPARVVATVFLVALIAGYSVSIAGSLASEQDYAIRDVYSSVGSDLSISLSSPENASQTLLHVAGSSMVSVATIEYSFDINTYGGSVGSLRIIALNPEEWPHVAYYEDEWFTGSSVASAFQAMASDDYTIVLDWGIYNYLGLNKGDYLALTLNNGSTLHLKVVGSFGSEKTQKQQSLFSKHPTPITKYWSYIPQSLYWMLKNQVSNNQARVLTKLNNVHDGALLSSEIKSLSPEIGIIFTVDEQLETLEDNAVLIIRINIQRLGVILAVLAASIGMVLVTVVSLNEKKREICMMSVRGISKMQLIRIFLAENLALVLFSILLGVTAGLGMMEGNIILAGSPNVSPNPLITRRVIFPLDSALIVGITVTAVLASVTVPVLLMVSRYITQLDKVVRQT